jgi:hypothetical protein
MPGGFFGRQIIKFYLIDLQLMHLAHCLAQVLHQAPLVVAACNKVQSSPRACQVQRKSIAALFAIRQGTLCCSAVTSLPCRLRPAKALVRLAVLPLSAGQCACYLPAHCSRSLLSLQQAHLVHELLHPTLRSLSFTSGTSAVCSHASRAFKRAG